MEHYYERDDDLSVKRKSGFRAKVSGGVAYPR